ncbi:alpha-ketoacid dehydrogenase subunit beta [Candidatus Woesearchaeota archaeon]|nr:alpha-ketoacid dehydrogenase subunit beta [Candidatus Woesearchaeota archaeon]
MAKLTMVQALNQAFDQVMAKDKDVVLLGEDIGIDGGVFRVTDGLIKKYPDRVFDTPLAEVGIIGASIGMAVYGMKPVAEIQFMGFVYPAMNQIISHAARFRNRTRSALTVPMVIRMPCQGGIRALEHHSESTESLFAQIPGLKVVMPATPYDAKGLMIAAINDPDPVIFLEPKKVYRSIKEEVPEEIYEVPIGKANIIQEGIDLTIITWGTYVKEVMDAIRDSKVSIELIDLRTISPLDNETIINSAKKTGRVLIIHEAPKTCSVGAEISARITEKAFLNLQAPVMRLAGYDIIMPLAQGENLYLVSKERIDEKIKQMMEF